MKTILTLLLPAFAGTLAAQDIAPKDSERDPILAALLEAEGDPSSSAELSEESDKDQSDSGSNDSSSSEAIQLLPPSPLPSDPPKGVRVEVEAGASKTRFTSSQIKLVAPFPARPLAQAPRGWHLIHPQQITPLSQSVTLANGSEITLSIRPHVLVPDADGAMVFALSEPGFDPALQYAQKQTMGSILADSIMSLDEQSDRLGAAAQRLEELLNSLPTPPPVAQPVTKP